MFTTIVTMSDMISRTSNFSEFAKRASNRGIRKPDRNKEYLQLINKENEIKERPFAGKNRFKSLVIKQQNGNVINSTTETILKPSTENDLAQVVTTANAMKKATEKFMAAKNLRTKIKSQMRKIAEERLTIKQVFARYVESSTLHGFRYVCSDTFLIRRIIWGLLMILGGLYFILKLRVGILEYLEFPFSTLSTVEQVDTLQFPAISFCPVNQYRLSKIKNSSLYPFYLQNRLPLSKNWSDPVMDLPGDEFYRAIQDISYTLSDVFMSCEYVNADTAHPERNIRKCSKHNFTSYYAESGQMCFTLNSGEEGHAMMEVDMEGHAYAFEVLFDLKNYDRLMELDYTAIQVIIHDQSDPSVSKNGFFLSAGSETFAQISKVETENLPPPYATQCGEIHLKYYSTYNQKACLLERLTDFVGEQCNCREPFMPDNGKPFCSIRETILCSFPSKERFDEFSERDGCPVECLSVKFDTTLSSTPFVLQPKLGIEERLINQQIQAKNYSHLIPLVEMSKRMSKTNLETYISENVVVAMFYFGDMSKIIQIQEATFDFYQFLGDMGGEIGLMLGASLLTFVEFVDVFGFLAYQQLLRLYKQKKEQHRHSMMIKRQSLIMHEESNKV